VSLMVRAVSLALVVGCLTPGLAAAQAGFEARVKVAVTENPIMAQVVSHITRELRELQGVTVVKDNPDWTLEIIAAETKTTNGSHLGYVLSTVVLKHYGPESRKQMTAFIADEFSRQLMGEMLFIAPPPAHDHSLQLGTDLRELCEAVVAKFDGRFLEVSRR
jgi:hypothetical protein